MPDDEDDAKQAVAHMKGMVDAFLVSSSTDDIKPRDMVTPSQLPPAGGNPRLRTHQLRAETATETNTRQTTHQLRAETRERDDTSCGQKSETNNAPIAGRKQQRNQEHTYCGPKTSTETIPSLRMHLLWANNSNRDRPERTIAGGNQPRRQVIA